MIKTNKNTKFTINSGIYKQTKLFLPHDLSTRPTKSILKQSCFNSLQNIINQCIFIECFGGCGSMGLEAISNGAKEAIFFENNKLSYDVLSQNINIINSQSTKHKCQTYFADFFLAYNDVFNGIKDSCIVYMDPPFPIRENMNNIYLKCIDVIKSCKNPNIFLIILEYMSGADLPHTIGDFELEKNKKFGKSSLAFFKRIL